MCNIIFQAVEKTVFLVSTPPRRGYTVNPTLLCVLLEMNSAGGT